MKKTDRFEAILGRLASGASIAVDELASDFGTSTATIRRDLGELARQSLLTRTHGGATARDMDYELPVRYRTTRHAEKQRIGAAAASLIPDGAVVGISGGTTTTEAARALAGHSRLTVVTNALNIAAELALRTDIQLVVTGGVARSASFELVGSMAEQTVLAYNLDFLLLGVDGIDAQAGCTTHDGVEARTNAAMVSRAKRVFVLADASKLGRITFANICSVNAVDALITTRPKPDERPSALADPPVDANSDEALDRLASTGLEVLQA